MKSINLVVAAAALAVSGAAIAGPSYTYADLGFTVGDSFGNNNDTDGYAIRGSFGFADVFHVGGGITDGDVDGGKGSGGADNSGYNVYVGFNPAMTENLDLVARIGYFDEEFKFDGGKEEATGVSFEIGPRAMVSDNLELNAAVSLLLGEDKDGGVKEDFTLVAYRVGGEYYFTPALSLGLDAAVASGNQSEANIHVRYSFGNN